MLRSLPTRMLAILSAFLLAGVFPYALAQHPRHHDREHKRDERSQIIALEKEWQKAALADDIPAMDNLLSDDYLGINASGEVLTKTQQLDHMRDGKFMLTKLDVSDTRIKLVGKIAIVTCLAQVEGQSDGEPLHGAYRYTRVYQRLPNGNWKVTSFEVTPAMRQHPSGDSH